MPRKPPEEGALRFLAERRVGKTSIITKMSAEPTDGFDVLFLEVEGIDCCDRLTELLLNRFRPLLTKTETAKSWFKGIWESAVGHTKHLPYSTPSARFGSAIEIFG